MKTPVSVRDIISAYWQHIRPFRTRLGFLYFFLMVATIVEISIPLQYKHFFDLLQLGVTNDPMVVAALWSTILNVIGLNIINWVIYRSLSFAMNTMVAQIQKSLSAGAYAYIQRHSFGFFSNTFVGSLVKKVSRFSMAFNNVFSKTFWDVYPLIIRIAGIIIVLWLIKPSLAVVLLVWIVLFIALNYSFALWKLKYDKQRALKDSESTGVLADAVTNQNNVQLFNGQEYELKRYEGVLEDVRRLRTLTWNLGDVMEGLQAATMIGVEFALMYLALRYWQIGTLTIGTFVLVQSYLTQLIIRLWDFGRLVRDMYESFADAEELVSILKTPQEITDSPMATTLVVPNGKIEFKDVGFSYHQTRTVLHDINLQIEPGEKVAFIGPSGSGKSTIVKLLFRLYDVDKGKILIDGQRIQLATQESLHEALSLVPQDPILFHRTLIENIRYGRPDATEEEVIEAARQANCDEFIEGFPEQYHTYVGERGVKLSGGERQRVAIARAILRNAPILVLDEATSSLDSHSEALIQQALKRLMKGKTTIVIAHRLSTIQEMDRIVVLEYGKITEIGTHQQLLSRPESLYRRLWSIQAGGFLVNENAAAGPSDTPSTNSHHSDTVEGEDE